MKRPRWPIRRRVRTIYNTFIAETDQLVVGVGGSYPSEPNIEQLGVVLQGNPDIRYDVPGLTSEQRQYLSALVTPFTPNVSYPGGQVAPLRSFLRKPGIARAVAPR